MDTAQTRNIILRLPRLVIGLILGSFCISLQIEANLGLGSWTTLTDGITKHLPLTMGQASIAVSFIIIAIDLFAKEKIGLGMIFNMFLMGGFTDVIRGTGIIPTAPGMLTADGSLNPGGIAMGVGMIFLSLCLMGVSSFLYIGAGLGAGPRDTLMVVVMKLTNKPLAICRNTIEISALTVGWLLGGQVGIGTVIVSFCTGPIMQLVLGWFKFSPKTIRHITVDELPGIFTGDLRIETLVNPPPTPAEEAVAAMSVSEEA